MMPTFLSRRLLGVVVLVLLSGQRFCEEAMAQDANQRPTNFILIMADDLGWGDTGYNGHKLLKTPGLDAMARNGLRFNRFYAAAPVCSPTRGSCLTGRHPFRYGVFTANAGHMKPEELTLAEYLKSKGFRTGHFGKWHLGTLTTEVKDSNRGNAGNEKDFAPPSQHGFDHYFSTEAKTPTFDPLLKPKGKVSRQFWLPLNDRSQGVAYGTRYWKNGKEVKEDLKGDDSKIIMDEALKFIEAKPNDKFLSVIWFHAPHLPVVASDEDRAPFKNLDPYRQSYFGCIQALDRQIVRLRKRLRELEIADKTMICFCSDNGPEGNAQAPGSAGNLRGRKRSLYEGGVRVPGIIEWPGGIKAGTETNYVATTSDYFPTIVDLTDGKLPDRPYDGHSLKPVFDKNDLKRTSPVYFQTRTMAVAMNQQYKLVWKFNSGKKARLVELFDINADQSEDNNLVIQNGELVHNMGASLEAWRKSCERSLAGQDYDR